MLEWTDLRFLLAVQRGKTLSAAARKLGCDQTTVGRRIEALEAALDRRLFRRTPDGYFPTREGELALARAERVEEEVMAIEREISGRDERPEGQVRLTTYESMGQCFLSSRLGAFRQRYPEIELQLNMDNRPLNLSRREADLAVRPGKPTQQALQIRKIGTVVVGLYASPGYLKRRGEPRTVEELAKHDVIDDEDANSHFALSRWLNQLARGAHVSLRCDSAVAQAAAASDGLGIVAVYCYVGDAHRGLKRILPKQQLAQDLWIAVHRDLQYAARVRAVIDFLVEVTAKDAAVLTGRARGDK
ncbi:MAG: LysR family transcriptional regulator [Polyangia bacterium]